MPVLSCNMWDLLPQAEIKPRAPALRALSPSHKPPGKSLKQSLITHMHCSLTLGSRRYIILYKWILLILQQELGQFPFLVSFRIVLCFMDVLFGSFTSKFSNSFCTFKELTKKKKVNLRIAMFFLISSQISHTTFRKEIVFLIKMF